MSSASAKAAPKGPAVEPKKETSSSISIPTLQERVLSARNVVNESVEPKPPQSTLNHLTEAGRSSKKHSWEPSGVVPRFAFAEPVLDDWEQDSFLRNAKEEAHTLMEKECTTDEIVRVWECISKFIILNLVEGKGVRIAGLGLFTFRIHKTPVNQKEVKAVKIPVFRLSEYLVKMYGLRQQNVYTSGVPETSLNLSVIANEGRLDRGAIEGILTEVLQAFVRGIVCNKNLEFPFPYIGKLQIHNQKAIFRFYEHFSKKLGYNKAQLQAYDSKFIDSLIPGRMTPLRLHIPTETFRSVFHLREVRSVHELPLLGNLRKVGSKLIPVQSRDQTTTPPRTKEEEEEEVEEDEEPSLRPPLPLPVEELKPLLQLPVYRPRESAMVDSLIHIAHQCPDKIMKCLQSHVYKTIKETLGEEVVRFHTNQKSNNNNPLRRRTFSFSNPNIAAAAAAAASRVSKQSNQ